MSRCAVMPISAELESLFQPIALSIISNVSLRSFFFGLSWHGAKDAVKKVCRKAWKHYLHMDLNAPRLPQCKSFGGTMFRPTGLHLVHKVYTVWIRKWDSPTIKAVSHLKQLVFIHQTIVPCIYRFQFRWTLDEFQQYLLTIWGSPYYPVTSISFLDVPVIKEGNTQHTSVPQSTDLYRTDARQSIP